MTNARAEPVARFAEFVETQDPLLFDGTDPSDAEFMQRVERVIEEFSSRIVHPEFEFYPYFAATEGGRPYRGREELVEWNRDIATSFSQYRRRVLEQHDVAEDVLVVRLSLEATGRESGVPLEADIWLAVRVEDDLFRTMYAYLEREAAFAAAEELKDGEPPPAG